MAQRTIDRFFSLAERRRVKNPARAAALPDRPTSTAAAPTRGKIIYRAPPPLPPRLLTSLTFFAQDRTSLPRSPRVARAATQTGEINGLTNERSLYRQKAN